MKITWYFDFISPFAYLQHQHQHFDGLTKDIQIEYKPILLAGLLKHWNNVGPAEVPPKRIFTYKHCYWFAQKNKIAFKMPPAHPFNSLSALRLAIATGCKKESIQIIFETIWKQGLAIDSNQGINFLQQKLALSNISELISNTDIKQQLIENTQQAAKANVFGVPTFSVTNVNGEIENFWGMDCFEMFLDFMRSPNSFNDSEMKRIEILPEGIQRKR